MVMKSSVDKKPEWVAQKTDFLKKVWKGPTLSIKTACLREFWKPLAL